jgi:hypothetical protein
MIRSLLSLDESTICRGFSAPRAVLGLPVTQQGVHQRSGLGVTAVSDAVVQTAEQRTADADPVAEFVGEAASGMIAILGRGEQSTEKQQKPSGYW